MVSEAAVNALQVIMSVEESHKWGFTPESLGGCFSHVGVIIYILKIVHDITLLSPALPFSLKFPSYFWSHAHSTSHSSLIKFHVIGWLIITLLALKNIEARLWKGGFFSLSISTFWKASCIVHTASEMIQSFCSTFCFTSQFWFPSILWYICHTVFCQVSFWCQCHH